MCWLDFGQPVFLISKFSFCKRCLEENLEKFKKRTALAKSFKHSLPPLLKFFHTPCTSVRGNHHHQLFKSNLKISTTAVVAPSSSFYRKS